MLAKLAVFGFVLGFAVSARATVLTFDGLTVALISQDYGDRVATTNQGGYVYGAGNGYTPNVLLEYAPSTGSYAMYVSGYASLSYALGHPQFNIPGEIRFVPDAGYRVRLNSFQLASWAASSYTANLRIWDDDGSFASPNLFSGSVSVPSGTVVVPLPGPVLGRGTVHLYCDIWGSVGIDNIDFDQTVVPGVPLFPYER